MENKYYQPLIEDLYVGYECEINTPRGWRAGKFPELLKLNSELDEFKEDDLMKSAHAQLRVPFLTKGQVEAEGWDFLYKQGGLIVFRKGSRELGLCSDHTIFIDNGESYDENVQYYKGKCPSINELRKLEKLLNIK